MACKNENCRCRNWCSEEINEAINPYNCCIAKAISAWLKAKVAGLRDLDEDFTEEDFEDG